MYTPPITGIALYVCIKDQMKWTKMTIPDLPLNKIFRISLETWFVIRHMQMEKNQRKINFHIVGTYFRKNVNLATTLRIIQF